VIKMYKIMCFILINNNTVLETAHDTLELTFGIWEIWRSIYSVLTLQVSHLPCMRVVSWDNYLAS
jgi:hypothetical protein